MIFGPVRAGCGAALWALALTPTAPCAAQQAQATAASPLFDQAMPAQDATHPDAAKGDEDSRWPSEARVTAPDGTDPAHDPHVPATASVSITDAAAQASEDNNAPAATPDHHPTRPPTTEATPATAPAPRDVVAQPGSSVDSATLRRMADKLIAMGFLAQGDDANDPAVLAEALRAFQTAAGIAPTGTLDRDTIGRLLS